MEPAMMVLDMLATLINQRHLVRCFKNLERIDAKLATEGVEIDYRPLQRLSIVLIVITLCRNILMVLFGYFVFRSNVFRLCAVYAPICIIVLSKIYFVLIVCNIRMKFDAINSYLDELANSLDATNQSNLRAKNLNVTFGDSNANDDKGKSSVRSTNAQHSAVAFLPNEIFVKPKPKFFQILPALNVRKPFESREFVGVGVGDGDGSGTNNEIPSIVQHLNEQIQFPMAEFPQTKNGTIIIGDRFDKRLTNLCFLHDEICEIVGIVNYMFSFQMLMLMAYGFLVITAQLYFVYCGLANQVSASFPLKEFFRGFSMSSDSKHELNKWSFQAVPRLFRSAENIGISSVSIISTAIVCVYVIYVCWETKNSVGKTGVYLHKLANIVDENHFYEMVNGVQSEVFPMKWYLHRISI